VQQWVALRSTEDEAANATEAVDDDADRAGCRGGTVGIRDSSELGLERRAADKEAVNVRLAREDAFAAVTEPP